MAIAMRQFDLPTLIKYWDALERKGHAAGADQKRMVIRSLCLADLFYLLVRVCGRKDMLHQWVYGQVRMVEASPDDNLDLWSRGHFKSSIITFGLTIQDVLKNPDDTFGIFSHTRPIAKAFLRQIMRELESNAILHNAFPDVLWGKDTRAAPKWSEDDGIIVRRKSNPPEATIEAWGLVDGQPTSKHFKKLLYDDVVVEGSVTTPEMIEKTTKALEQSYNLTNEVFSRRFAGTRWHYNDSYRAVMDRGTAKARKHPCTIDGTEFGHPVFWTEQAIAEKRRDMGPYTFAAQCLLDPKADALQGFKREWLRFYKTIDSRNMNTYILVDAASEKKKGSDYTAMWVIGLNTDGNYYALDIIRDRLNLTERTARLFELVRKYRECSRLQQVRYEKYGLMADVEHIKTQQEAKSYRFDITEVGGQTPKRDRIGRMIPIYEQGKFYLPQSLHKTDYQKVPRDLVQVFIEEEYAPFPVGLHDDLWDAQARIAEPDLKLVWPKEEVARPKRRVVNQLGAGAWMA